MRNINFFLMQCIVLITVSTYAQTGSIAKQTVRVGVKNAIKSEVKSIARAEAKNMARQQAKAAVKGEAKAAVKAEMRAVIKKDIGETMAKSLSKDVVKKEAKVVAINSAKQNISKHMSVSAVEAEATVSARHTLSSDMAKNPFSQMGSRINLAKDRIKIRPQNQYINSESYTQWAAKPGNASKMSEMNFGQPKSGKVLRDNMKLCMGENYQYAEMGGNAAHHIVGGGTQSAPAQAVLEKYGIDINDPRNGIFLPNSPENILKGTNHSGKHTNDYFNEVNRRMSGVKSKEECLEVLDDLKKELYDGSLHLYKDHQKNTIMSSFTN